MAGFTRSLIKRISRTSVAYTHDVGMAALSFPLSLYLRLGEDLPIQVSQELLVFGTIGFGVVAAVVFRAMGLYRGIWRYASTNDLWAIVRAVSVAVIVFVLALFLATRLQGLPRSTPAINWLLLIFLLGGPRFIYRVFKDRHFGHVLADGTPRVPVLLVGAGDQAEAFIRAVTRDAAAPYRIVGVVDTKDHRVGRRIHGFDVLGDLGAIPDVVARLEKRGKRPQRLILTKQNIEADTLRQLLDVAEKLGMTLGQLPRLAEVKSTDPTARLEPTAIPIEDLLGRPRRVLDRDAMRRLVAGKRVLVTGSGGTIGGELTRQIAAFGPSLLALVDHSEYALYSIDLEIGRLHPDLPRETILADVRDRARLDLALGSLRPELVFHAAALKHVPMVEANPEEGVLTNVMGTRNVADACRKHGVAAMVMVSTDKAVDPTSVMGATKRLAESYCQALDRARSGGTRYVTVRFGNVLGSSGSVVPLFQRQIAEGGPLTVTHPEAVRYFMTVREAVELVIEASALGTAEPAEPGRILVLDMGEPVRVVDLARQMIRLSGLTPDKDIKIVFTGLRPGEKLTEVLLHSAEPLQPTRYPGILFASPRATDHAVLARALDELFDAAQQRRTQRVADTLQRLVPEYTPDGDRVRLAAAATR